MPCVGLHPSNIEFLKNSGLHQRHIEDIRELDQSIEKADWIVDGLFGTGLTRPIESQTLAGQVINKINQSGKPILALDIPSGLDANTGSSLGVTIKALVTASFVAAKIGYENPTSKAWTGYVEVVDIGYTGSDFSYQCCNISNTTFTQSGKRLDAVDNDIRRTTDHLELLEVVFEFSSIDRALGTRSRILLPDTVFIDLV